MTKEIMLRKAFSRAIANAAINFVDEGVDFLVIKAEMVEFARIHQVEVAETEIEEYIREQFRLLHEEVKDFSFQSKMMK